MKNSGISSDEWLKELIRLSERQDQGLTVAEWASKLGVTESRVDRSLTVAYRNGWLIAGKRSALSRDGRQIKVNVYRVEVPKEKV